jgi:putative transcriptional regulator
MNEKIANSVKEHRRTAGLTQEELADAMNVSRQTIISIERGKYVPSLPLALKLAAFFKCSTDDIFKIEKEVR